MTHAELREALMKALRGRDPWEDADIALAVIGKACAEVAQNYDPTSWDAHQIEKAILTLTGATTDA